MLQFKNIRNFSKTCDKYKGYKPAYLALQVLH